MIFYSCNEYINYKLKRSIKWRFYREKYLLFNGCYGRLGLKIIIKGCKMEKLQNKYKKLNKGVRNCRVITLIGLLAVPFPFVVDMDLLKGGLAISLLGFLLFLSGIIAWVMLKNNKNVAKQMLDSESVFASWTVGENEVVLSKRGIFYDDEIRQCDAYSDFFTDAQLTMENKLIITDFHNTAKPMIGHKEIITIDVPEEYLIQASKAAEFYREASIKRL